MRALCVFLVIGLDQKGRPFASTMRPVVLPDKTTKASLTYTVQTTIVRTDVQLPTVNPSRYFDLNTVCTHVGVGEAVCGGGWVDTLIVHVCCMVSVCRWVGEQGHMACYWL